MFLPLRETKTTNRRSPFMPPSTSRTGATKVLVLTDFYPIGLQETFITPELETLSSLVDHVTIVPTNLESLVEKGIRSVPTNVSILSDVWENAREKWQSMSRISKLLLSKSFIRSCWREKRKFSTPFQTTLGESAYAMHVSQEIERSIDLHEYEAISSFWLNRPAFIGAILKKKYPHLRFLSRAHRGDIIPKIGSKTIPFQPFLMDYVDEVHVVSQDGVNTLQSIHPKASERIVVGRMGVMNQKQNHHRSNDGKLRLISMSRVVDVKRVNLIAESLSFVSREIHWTHFGTGPGMRELEEKTTSLPSNIEVSLPGFVESHDTIHSALQSQPWDILLNVSTSEGVPAAIQECFSYGIPALVTEVGGNPEIVDFTCGHLLPSNPTPEEIATILEEWNIDNEQMRTSALNRQREMFDIQKNAQQYVKSLLKNN